MGSGQLHEGGWPGSCLSVPLCPLLWEHIAGCSVWLLQGLWARGSAKTLPAEGGGMWSDGHFRMTQGKVGQGFCRPRGATENSLRPCGKGGQEA